VSGVGFHGDNIVLFKFKVVGVDKKTFAGVLKLNLDIFIFIFRTGNSGEIVKGVELSHASAETFVTEVPAPVI
jgi:hypothetical protein